MAAAEARARAWCLTLLLLVACAPAATPAARPPAAANSTASSPASAPAGAPASTPAAPPPLERIKVTFASDGAIYSPHFIAIEKGYYAEEGIEMEIIKAGGGVATPALISGEVQYSTSAASSVSAMLKGAPIKVVYTNSDRPAYDLWSSTPELRHVRELVGKSVGVQSRGDTMEIAARMLFQQHGVDPNQVSYAAMGVGSQRLAAVQSGAVAAAILGTSDVVQLLDAGHRGNRLANVREEVQMLYTGVATSDRELQEHRGRALRFLRATIKGREYYRQYRDATLDIMAKYNENPRNANEADYDDVWPAMTEDGSMPVDIQRRDALLRAEVNGVEGIPSVEQLYDYSLVKQIYAELRASGWRPSR